MKNCHILENIFSNVEVVGNLGLRTHVKGEEICCCNEILLLRNISRQFVKYMTANILLVVYA